MAQINSTHLSSKSVFPAAIVGALFVILQLLPGVAMAQESEVRASQTAVITQYVGDTAELTFTFSRPGVKGRTVWGELVPFVSPDDVDATPWRAGANENTTFSTTQDLLIEGETLPAGTYGIHMFPSADEWVIAFNNESDQWGSFGYNVDEDALRITVTPVEAPFQEWLLYGFDEINPSGATAFLHWESLKVPFNIELAQ
ncbi:MAG: DUF2911 domain-containing protein [Balneolaceae bacterium]|nr:DUF2911 domain-containing protein [Balneolaceae bacterium]MDR9446348.1 DUF2911 domain-containing protein [Balneolaceae bacterium]